MNRSRRSQRPPPRWRPRPRGKAVHLTELASLVCRHPGHQVADLRVAVRFRLGTMASTAERTSPSGSELNGEVDWLADPARSGGRRPSLKDACLVSVSGDASSRSRAEPGGGVP